jgi:hypothetical protein
VSSAREAPSCRTTVLEWGAGPGQVGLLAGGEEHLARGPQAVAIAPGGDVLVLDSVGGRVLAIDSSGASRIAVDGIPHDAEDLAIGADGAIAVWSPLQAKAWMFDEHGVPIGTVAVDRAIRNVTGIGLGASHQLVVRTAYQETLSAGSPAAPVTLPTMLAGKREGAFLLTGGRGVSVRANGTSAALVITDNPLGRRASTRATYPLPGDITAAMPVGLASDIACLRTEQVDQTDRLHVARRAVCMDATTGQVRMDLALAAPDLYLPAHELAVGGATPSVAMLEPSAEHLVVRTCEVAR